ncbi:MAG: formimidoylglutamase [Phycisphaerales bacterium]
MPPIPHTARPDRPPMTVGKFAGTIRHDSDDGCAIALVGLPDDTGVALNNGRPGAQRGPAAFRAALASYGNPWDARDAAELPPVVYDAGDVVPVTTDEAGGDPVQALHATHERITEALFAVHKRGLMPVCVGGGHDLTYPCVRALSQHLGAGVAGVNVDAHLDVRETDGSGMPFRAGIENGFIDATRFIEFGVARFGNSRAHCEWLQSRFAEIVTVDRAVSGDSTPASAMAFAFDGRTQGDEPAGGFVSIDLDAIDGAMSVGVSAVNPNGLTVQHCCEFAERAGAHPGVRHFDIMELNPRHDDGRTARIAALLFLHFVAGYRTRRA